MRTRLLLTDTLREYAAEKGGTITSCFKCKRVGVRITGISDRHYVLMVHKVRKEKTSYDLEYWYIEESCDVS